MLLVYFMVWFAWTQTSILKTLLKILKKIRKTFTFSQKGITFALRLEIVGKSLIFQLRQLILFSNINQKI